MSWDHGTFQPWMNVTASFVRFGVQALYGLFPWLWGLRRRPPGTCLPCAFGSPLTRTSCNLSASPRALPSSRNHSLPSRPLRVPTLLVV